MRNSEGGFRAIGALAAVLLAQASFGQVILRVDGTNGSAAGDGSAWGASSFQFLQDALAAAAPLASGGQTVQIWIAQGTYKPDRDAAHPAGTGDRTATFAMMSRVEVYGGFVGSETSLDQRDPAPHVVTLSGDLLGDDGAAGIAGKLENAKHVMTASGTDGTALIDSVTVSGGYQNVDNAVGGAGLRITSSSIRAANSVFRDHRVSRMNSRGAAVEVVSGSPSFISCTFDSNQNDAAFGAGGAIFSMGDTTIGACVFTSNYSLGRGGAIAAQNGSLTVHDCTFSANQCATDGDGGALANLGGTTILVSDSTFHANVSISNSGGAVFGGARLERCTFLENKAGLTTGGYGGAIAASSGQVVAIDCSFERNSAYSRGGACWGTVPFTLVGCSFVGNTAIGNAGFSGGGACWGGPYTIANCVFEANQSLKTVSIVVGGAVHGSGTIINSTFVGNYPNAVQTDPSGTYSQISVRNSVLWNNGGSTQDDQIFTKPGGTLTVDHSLILGWTGALGGVGNFDADPRFVSPGPDGVYGTADDNLRLSWDSPCIDAGDTSALPPDTYDLDNDGDTTEPLPIDFDGLARRFDDLAVADTGVGPAPVVDIGAFEYRCLADFNADGFVIPADMDSFLDEFVAGTAAADIDRNGFTNGDDFDLYAAALNAGC